jgi:hypothetical protein
MVASSPPEPSANDYAALVQRLDAMQRQIDEAGRAPKFPFVVSHGGTQDFAIKPSVSGDGSADIFIGNGAGGKLIQVITDPVYLTKIFKILDQNGSTMMSTDALAGYGIGTPSLPFVYAGYESLNLSGATSQGTATEFARGSNFVYNPAAYILPRIRLFSTTAETVKVFAQWKDAQGNLNNTADVTVNLSAGVVNSVGLFRYGKVWDANDMNGICGVFLKAYCTSGTPANVNITGSYQEGYGISKRFYLDNSPNWAV